MPATPIVDSPPEPNGPRPEPPATRRRPRVRILLVLLALVSSSCTFHSGQQMEVSYTGTRYRMYLYQRSSTALVFLRADCRRRTHYSREAWARCSLTYLRESVNIPALTQVDWNHFTEGGRWADYAGALEDLVSGGYASDAEGVHTKRCTVGDHMAFGSYNWTFREPSDGHCARGTYPT